MTANRLEQLHRQEPPMSALRYAGAALCSAWLFLSSAPTPAQDAQAKTDYEPYVGQHGKDVIWVPTPQRPQLQLLLQRRPQRRLPRRRRRRTKATSRGCWSAPRSCCS
jgi:hypothetical protein